MSKPAIICLTPVKNEAWILERFLKCAGIWADHIIIADQHSDDGSREIAQRFPKVILLKNQSAECNESQRQKMLIEAARRISYPRLLITLDADEFLTADFLSSKEWETMLHAAAGTVMHFQWPIIQPDLSSYWTYPYTVPLGFMDDGTEHTGRSIHSIRIPLPPAAPELHLKEIRVMHYAFVNAARQKSKMYWYQCWELLNRIRRPVEIYRGYHNDFEISPQHIKAIPPEWFSAYQQQGIDMTSILRYKTRYHDEKILELFAQHGTRAFRKLAIWDVSWNAVYRQIHPDKEPAHFRDPRSMFDICVHAWLKKTQPYFGHYAPPAPLRKKLEISAMNALLRFSRWQNGRT